MAIMFNTLLHEAGLSLSDVRLIRHKDKRSKNGQSPYELWSNNGSKFELYQSIQRIPARKKFSASHWAVFVVNHNNETLFAGLYSVNYLGLSRYDIQMPHNDTIEKAGSCDEYDLQLTDILSEHIGKLVIEWGPGARAWVQRADKKNKVVIKL
jgi:hypothetical protein